MASNDHTKDSSGSPTSEYAKWKQYIIDIENEPEDLNTTKWNIYKVPCNLRSLNEPAYTPHLVSIGPIHHGLEKLIPMQEQKLRYLKLFWSQVENKTKDMDEFKNLLEKEEENIRKRYAENLCNNINKDKLVEMMLLDSVFIMELFLRIQRQKSAASAEEDKEEEHEQEQEENKNNKVEKQTYSHDIIVKQSWLNKSIQRDLLLLENQIPLFILEKLYKRFVPYSRKEHSSFIELARDYFDCYHTYKKCYEEKKSSSEFARLVMNCGIYKKGDSSSGEKAVSSDSKADLPQTFHRFD